MATYGDSRKRNMKKRVSKPIFTSRRTSGRKGVTKSLNKNYFVKII